MAISDAIKLVRTERNLKQDDVAELVGVSVQTYSKWESGKTEPKASQIIELAEIFHTSTERLLFNKEDSTLDTLLKERFNQASELRPKQKAVLLDLIDSYCFRYKMLESFPSDIYDEHPEYAKESYKQQMHEVLHDEKYIDDMVDKEVKKEEELRMKLRENKRKLESKKWQTN